MENRPNRPTPESEQKQNFPQARDGSRVSLDRKLEQTPQGGSDNKPDLHPPEEESGELARDNDAFFRQMAKLIDSGPLSEDFHKRLRERLRQ